MTRNADLVNLIGQMEDHMKVNGRMVSNMERECTSQQVGIEKEDIGKRAKELNG